MKENPSEFRKFLDYCNRHSQKIEMIGFIIGLTEDLYN